MKDSYNSRLRLAHQLQILKLSKIVKDLERINKIKADLRKGNKYYDEGIKPENRRRDDEHPDSN